MQLYDPLDNIPYWAMFVITTVVFFIAYECGFRVGRRKRTRRDHNHEVVVRSMVASMAALLTFLLAFTFWIAASHFDASRQSFLNETNAIRTTFLRADFFPEPNRTRIRTLLREYIDVRIETAGKTRIDPLIKRTEELQKQIWTEAVEDKELTSSPIFAGYFIQSLNEMITLQARRLVVHQDFRIPTIIWLALHIIGALTVACVGFHGGSTEKARPLVFPAYILLFAVSLLLIKDLDRPMTGNLRVNTQAMIDLRETMKTM